MLNTLDFIWSPVINNRITPVTRVATEVGLSSLLHGFEPRTGDLLNTYRLKTPLSLVDMTIHSQCINNSSILLGVTVTVVQLVEHQIVVLDVADSSSVGHL